MPLSLVEWLSLKSSGDARANIYEAPGTVPGRVWYRAPRGGQILRIFKRVQPVLGFLRMQLTLILIVLLLLFGGGGYYMGPGMGYYGGGLSLILLVVVLYLLLGRSRTRL